MKRLIRRLMMRKRSALSVRVRYWVDNPSKRADLLEDMAEYADSIGKPYPATRLQRLSRAWRIAANIGDWREMAALAKKRIRE